MDCTALARSICSWVSMSFQMPGAWTKSASVVNPAADAGAPVDGRSPDITGLARDNVGLEGDGHQLIQIAFVELSKMDQPAALVIEPADFDRPTRAASNHHEMKPRICSASGRSSVSGPAYSGTAMSLPSGRRRCARRRALWPCRAILSGVRRGCIHPSKEPSATRFLGLYGPSWRSQSQTMWFTSTPSLRPLFEPRQIHKGMLDSSPSMFRWISLSPSLKWRLEGCNGAVEDAVVGGVPQTHHGLTNLRRRLPEATHPSRIVIGRQTSAIGEAQDDIAAMTSASCASPPRRGMPHRPVHSSAGAHRMGLPDESGFPAPDGGCPSGSRWLCQKTPALPDTAATRRVTAGNHLDTMRRISAAISWLIMLHSSISTMPLSSDPSSVPP